MMAKYSFPMTSPLIFNIAYQHRTMEWPDFIMKEMVYWLSTKYPKYGEYSGGNIGGNRGDPKYGTDFRHTDRPKFGLEFRIMDLVPLSAIFQITQLIFLLGLHSKSIDSKIDFEGAK
jgi:hypothetical protein